VHSRTCMAQAFWEHYQVDGQHGGALMGKVIAAGLDNPSDVLVGGGPGKPFFKGKSAFLRLCLGTFADARTTIDELRAWEFAGPQFAEFTGRVPPRANATPAPCRAAALHKNPEHAENDSRKPVRWERSVQLRLLSRHVPFPDWPSFDPSLDDIDAFFRRLLGWSYLLVRLKQRDRSDSKYPE